MPPETVTNTPATPPAAASNAPAQGTPATPARQQPDKAAQREKMREVSRQVLGKAQPAKPEPTTTSAPTPAAERTAERIEQAGGDVPEQKTGESNKDYELRLSKALTDLQKAQQDALGHRKRADTAEGRATTAEARVKDLERILEEAKDPVKALRLAGETPESVARMMMEGKLKRSPYSDLPPEVAKRLEELERKETERESVSKREREEAEQRAEAERARAADLSYLEANMADYKAKYPFVTAPSGAAARMLDHLYSRSTVDEHGKRQVDVDKELSELEQGLSADVEALLSSEAVVKALCAKPGVRDTLSKALAGMPTREQSSQASPASEDRGKHTVEEGPRSLTQSAVSEVPAPRTPTHDPSEQKARIRSAGREVLSRARLMR